MISVKKTMGIAVLGLRRKIVLVASLTVVAAMFIPASAAQAATGGTDLPWRTSGTGYSTANLQTGQVHAVLTSAEGLHLGATGNRTNLSVPPFEEFGQIVPTGVGTFNWFSTWTINASDGAQITGGCTGTGSTPDGVHFTLTLICPITGGTGRFEGATGSFNATVHSTRVSTTPPTATNAIEVSSVGYLNLNR